MTLEEYKDIIHRCFRCGYCKFSYDFSDFNCPAYKKYRFESYSSGGKMWLIHGILNNELQWSENIAKILFSCSTCGNCVENCRFDKFNEHWVDIIEAARSEAVKNGFCLEAQKKLSERTSNEDYYNPYGEKHSNNENLKKQYNLPDKAEWVYFIGCTSNYRQQTLRDATIRFLKKAKIDFTIINERCCTSPLIRTGQIDEVRDFMNYNIEAIKKAGASKVITSCAGCYKTIKNDFRKQGVEHNLEIYHTSELIKKLLDDGKIEIQSGFDKTITYHDPCHVGRHSGLYDTPRAVYQSIPGVKMVEMRRNRENSWCCGAGGGVKIGFPDWALEVSKERVLEAKDTGATILTSICPFCKTNLSDANREYNLGLEILDLVEILDQLEIKTK
ncbi:MAG: 4Fe-4S dicluster domain-containing protein [Candidatus Lokiarchaeota archaeon]|nr:4Fe-4S dicluster domain-containing protein [Candidatus Lokiarchaeota archaeon]